MDFCFQIVRVVMDKVEMLLDAARLSICRRTNQSEKSGWLRSLGAYLGCMAGINKARPHWLVPCPAVYLLWYLPIGMYSTHRAVPTWFTWHKVDLVHVLTCVFGTYSSTYLPYANTVL